MAIKSTTSLVTNAAMVLLVIILYSQKFASATRWSIREDDGLQSSTSIASSSLLHTPSNADSTATADGSLLSSIIEVKSSSPHHAPIPQASSDDSLLSLITEVQSSSPRHAPITQALSDASLLSFITEIQSSSPHHAPIPLASSDASSVSSDIELSRGPISPPKTTNVDPSAPVGPPSETQRIRLRGTLLLPSEVDPTRPVGPPSTTSSQSTTTSDSDDFSISLKTASSAPKQHPGFLQETGSATQTTPLQSLLHSLE